MNDLTFAVRTLAKNPGFVATATASLALGIGLNTAMFGLTNAMYLRPLPFSDAKALVRVYRTTPGTSQGDLSAGDFRDLRTGASDFGDFAASADENVSVAEAGQPAQLEYADRVTSNYFHLLGVHPALGRGFAADEEASGHPVVVISDELWRRRFAAEPNVLGKTLRIEGMPYEIVGVLPASADDGRVVRHVGLFRPLGYTASDWSSRGDPWVRVIGRRAPGISESKGNALVAALGRRLAHDFPKDDGSANLRCANLLGATGNDGGKIVTLMLMALSAFVLLIACSNIANLVLARTIERAQDLSIRAALGASRFALIRPLAIESLLLAASGGVVSVLVAMAGTRWLSDQSVADGGSPMQFPLDWRVLCFAGGTSIATAIFFGTAPALVIGRMNMRGAARSPASGRTHQRFRRVLVIGQFAMAMTLLAGAVFLGRGAAQLLRQHFGWDTTHVVGGSFELSKARYDTPEKILSFDRTLSDKLRGLPGTEFVSISYALPYSGSMGNRSYLIEGQVRPAKGQEPSASFDGVSPGFFQVTGTPLIAGRGFLETDGPAAPRVVVINEGMARTLFPGENPIGRRIARADTDKPEWATIVGIAADVRPAGLYQKPPEFQVYHPLAQEPWLYSRFAIRTRPGAETAVRNAIGAAFVALDPDLPARNVMSADEMVARASFDLGMLMKMLAAFAGLGLLLAAVGIYGVIARTVAQRTSEIGIRMALGATKGNVVRLILGSGLRLILFGAAIGLAGAIGSARLLAGMMPALESSPAAIVAQAALVLAGVGLLACYLPARAAARVDPLCAIRAE